MTREELYMQRALDLAQVGQGSVSPNPMVGCVIVKGNRIIGEGWHQFFGGPHAEVNAINSIKDKSQLEGAELFVTLEPCAHHGKTPPCANLVIQFPFRKVYIANVDPNPLVAGKGIEIIRNAGIEVQAGILETKGLNLNKRFFYSIQNKLPYVILKWAETNDGFIAREDYSSKWISNDLSRTLVHKWRAEEAAIMVGRNTVTCDNPSLTVRQWTGRNPVRVVLDPELKIKGNYAIFNEEAETLIYNCLKSDSEGSVKYIQLNSSNILNDLLSDLYKRGIQSVLIEGGSKLLHSFLKAGLWNEIRRFKSKTHFEKGISAPKFTGTKVSEENVAGDLLEVYINDR